MNNTTGRRSERCNSGFHYPASFNSRHAKALMRQDERDAAKDRILSRMEARRSAEEKDFSRRDGQARARWARLTGAENTP